MARVAELARRVVGKADAAELLSQYEGIRRFGR
jgi:hypothetical protein